MRINLNVSCVNNDCDKEFAIPGFVTTWFKVRHVIKRIISIETYNTWIKGVVPIGIKNDVVYLAVDKKIHKQMIEGVFQQHLTRALEKVMHKKMMIDVMVITKS